MIEHLDDHLPPRCAYVERQPGTRQDERFGDECARPVSCLEAYEPVQAECGEPDRELPLGRFETFSAMPLIRAVVIEPVPVILGYHT